MENVQEECSHSNKDECNEDEMFEHIDEVYGNAYWALRCGAPKEGLLGVIERASEAYQKDCLKGSGPGGE